MAPWCIRHQGCNIGNHFTSSPFSPSPCLFSNRGLFISGHQYESSNTFPSFHSYFYCLHSDLTTSLLSLTTFSERKAYKSKHECLWGRLRVNNKQTNKQKKSVPKRIVWGKKHPGQIGGKKKRPCYWLGAKPGEAGTVR